MTVPHISVGSWGPRRTGDFRVHWPARGGRAQTVAAPRAVGSTGIAWIDVVIQLLLGAALVYGVYWVVTFGIFHKGIDVFTDWYVDDIIPAFAVGTGPVMGGTEFRDGFFAPHPEVPAGLQWNAPSQLSYEQRFAR